MAEQLKLLNQFILDGTLQTAVTTAAGHTVIPKTVIVKNFSGKNGITSAVCNIDIYLVANGDVAGNKNNVWTFENLMPGQSQGFNLDVFLQAGYLVQVKSDIADVCNFLLSGVDDDGQ